MSPAGLTCLSPGRRRSARAPWSPGWPRDHPEIFVSVSATTRPPRPGEVDGRHYLFVSDDEFDTLIAEGALLEWAVVHGVHRYGTPAGPGAGRAGRGPPGSAGDRSAGRPAGAGQLAGGDGSSSWPRRRGTNWSAGWWAAAPNRPRSGRRRLATARAELAAQAEFDHVVVNREVGQAVGGLGSLGPICSPASPYFACPGSATATAKVLSCLVLT